MIDGRTVFPMPRTYGEAFSVRYAPTNSIPKRAVEWFLANIQAVLTALLIWVGSFKTDPVFGHLNRVVDLTAVVTVCLATCTVLVVVVRMKVPKLGIADVAFGLLVLIVVSGDLLEPSEYGFIKAATFGTVSLLLYIAGRVLPEGRALRIYVIALLASSLYIIISALRWGASVGSGLVRGAGTSYLGVAWAGGTTVIISHILAGTCHSVWLRWLLRATFSLGLIIIVMSGGRGPFVAVVSTFAVLWLVQRQKLVAKVLAILVGSAIIIVLLTSPLATRLLNRFSVMNNPYENTSINTRIMYYSAALSVIATNPLGIGTGQFPLVVGTMGRNYPHNIFLEVGAEDGWVGLSALMILIGLNLLTALRMIRKNVEPALGLIFIMALGYAMFSGDLNDHRLLWSVCGIISRWNIRRV